MVESRQVYDVVVVGGGPAGLAAALALGRARRRVLVCDGPSRRNAAAVHLHNFVTRDGVTPDEFRRIGRAQLTPYSTVEVRELPVTSISGARGAFQVSLGVEGVVEARRVLLCTGMIDSSIEIEGFSEYWGKSIFQCPYCHAWEIQGRAFGALALVPEMLEFSLLLRSWSANVVALTDGRYAIPSEIAARLRSGGVRLEERPIQKLEGAGGVLHHVECQDGTRVLIEFLFARPPQRHVPIVESLGLALNAQGFVQIDEMHRQTSIPGIYAAGDLITPMQAAIVAAAAGTHAAATLNHEFTVELALSGSLP